MRLVDAIRALLRRLRAERGVVALVFAVVALTSFAVAAGPRLFDRVADEALRYAVRDARPIQRNIQFATQGRVLPDSSDPGGPMATVEARGAAILASLPPSVAALVGSTGALVDATRFRLTDPPKLTTFVTLRQQDGLDDQIDLVAGRWPVSVPRAAPPTDDPPRIEIVVAEAAAAVAGLSVGDRWIASVDPNDPMLRTVYPRPDTEVEIDVVGLIGVRDPSAAYWFDERSLATADTGGTEGAPTASIVGVFARDAYPDVIRLGLPLQYRWNLFLDTDRFDAGDLDALVPDMRRLVAPLVTTDSVRPGALIVLSGLSGVLDGYLQQRATTEAALSLAALGPLVVAATAVALIGVFVVRRRRPAITLTRARGASTGQILAAQLWEGLLIALPAALLGLVLAEVLIPGRPNQVSRLGALVVGLAAVALMLAATWPAARRARRDVERDETSARRVAPRRLVFEMLLVGLAVAAAWLLRDRGLGPDGAARRFDPLLAAAPVLIGLAVAVVTVRIYPLPVRGLGWLAARRRDLVLVLGIRSLGRHQVAGYLPLLILTVTVAIGTLSSVLGTSLERSQVETTWQELGADIRVESNAGGPIDPAVDVPAVPGVGSVAAGLAVPGAPLSTILGHRTRIDLIAVEPTAYEAVLTDAPVSTSITPWFADAPTGPSAGTAADPIPIIVSTHLPSGSPDLKRGDRFELGLQGRTLTFVVVDRRDGFPGFAPGAPFAVAPYDSIAAGWTGDALRPNVLFVSGPADLAASIRASVPDPTALVVVSRAERLAAMRAAPLVAAVSIGFAIALLIAVAYAVLAILAVFVLDFDRRSREDALLRTLGLSDRQGAALTVVEQGVPLALALGLGIALGLAMAWLAAPGIDLAAFSGPEAIVGLQVDWSSIVLVAGSVVVFVAAAVAIAAAMARRQDLGGVLRSGAD